METAILRESSCERGGRAAILVQLREHFYRDCTLKAHKVTSDMNTQEKASRLGSVPWDHTMRSRCSVARPLRAFGNKWHTTTETCFLCCVLYVCCCVSS